MTARFFPKIDVREPVTLLAVGLSCFLLVMPSAASAQNGESSPPACASEEHRQFDFWVVWYNITPDDLDWVYELSSDDGATWEVVWPIHYERKR